MWCGRIARQLKQIYPSPTEEIVRVERDSFAQTWDDKYPQISHSWKNLMSFDYPKGIRKAIYTPNAIESLKSVVRKLVKTRKLFPNDEAAAKVVFLEIQVASKKWTMPIQNWK